MRLLFAVLLIVNLSGCGEDKESCRQLRQMDCRQLRQMEAFQLASRNTINSMNKEHSSDALQSALNYADDGLDILQAKLEKDCPQ